MPDRTSAFRTIELSSGTRSEVSQRCQAERETVAALVAESRSIARKNRADVEILRAARQALSEAREAALRRQQASLRTGPGAVRSDPA